MISILALLITVVSLEPPTLPPVSLGNWNVLVFFNEFTESTTMTNEDKASARQHLQKAAALTREMFLNMSYGRLNMSFTFYQNLIPLKLPKSSGFYCTENYGDMFVRIDDSLSISRQDSSRFNLIISATSIGSYPGDKGVCMNDIGIPGRAILSQPPYEAMQHEVGHTFFLPHTDTWLSNTPGCPFSSNGIDRAGGTGVDVMGIGEKSSQEDVPFMHFVMPQKVALDWTEMIRTVYLSETSVNVVLWPQDVQAPGMGTVTRGVKIMLPVEPSFEKNHISLYNELWLETRHLMRHDFTSRGVMMIMARKQQSFPHRYDTLVIDNTPQPGVSGSIYDGLLGPRRVQHYYHPVHSVTINNTAEMACPGFPYLTCYNVIITRTNPSAIPCPVDRVTT